MKIWVLLKWSERPEFSPGDVVVHSVHDSYAALEAKLERIASKNAMYPLTKIGQSLWRIGPEEDQGFFGHRPVYLRAWEATLR